MPESQTTEAPDTETHPPGLPIADQTSVATNPYIGNVLYMFEDDYGRR